jgi:hypothetical protein
MSREALSRSERTLEKLGETREEIRRRIAALEASPPDAGRARPSSQDP